MKLPAYPRTKPSGVEWLGDVPEHWEVKRSDAIVSADRSQLSPEKFADRDVFHYSIPVVQETGTGQVENGESIASAKQVVKKPVVLVSKLNPRKTTICLAKPQAILTLCSTEFVALNADKCELGFLEYLTRSELFRQGLDSKVQSVTRSHQRANPADIYKFWNAWPTPEDQRDIAAFLDRETGRVDRLVAKKRELIERLKEKRTALISRTVTRGLPPAAARAAGLPANPPLKPSGLDWLGDIPAHWKVKSLTRVTFSIRNGTSVTQLEDASESAVPVTRIESISGGRINFDKVGQVEWTPSLERYRLKKGDILLSHINSLSMVGNCAIFDSDRPLYSGMNLLRIEPEPTVHAPWLWRVLSSDGIRKEISARAKPAINQASVTTTQIKALQLPVPPLPEQAAIAAYLDEETAKLDALVGKVEEAVERLQEYRTALITAAVTGKIDVRQT
jgi:type I restriction enzyme, S subunit